jgi:hypothetical protein
LLCCSYLNSTLLEIPALEPDKTEPASSPTSKNQSISESYTVEFSRAPTDEPTSTSETTGSGHSVRLKVNNRDQSESDITRPAPVESHPPQSPSTADVSPDTPDDMDSVSDSLRLGEDDVHVIHLGQVSEVITYSLFYFDMIT